MRCELDYNSVVAYVKHESAVVQMLLTDLVYVEDLTSFILMENLKNIYKNKIKFIFRGDRVWLDIKD